MDATPVRQCRMGTGIAHFEDVSIVESALSHIVRHKIFPIVLTCVCMTGISCETLRAPGSTADWFARHGKSHERDIVAHREQWQTRREGLAMKWLLAHQLGNGMTVDEVNSKLGDIGEREEGTQEFKQKIEGLRVDDVLYRYGPARDGEVFYLAFREGKLVNFDAKYFAEKK